MWASVAGEDNRKVDGNAIFEGWCQNTSADNCSGNNINNSDRDTNGMLFEISNPTLQPLNIKMYDPGFCERRPELRGHPARYPACTGDEALSQLDRQRAAPEDDVHALPARQPLEAAGQPDLCQVTYPGYASVRRRSGGRRGRSDRTVVPPVGRLLAPTRAAAAR